MPTHAQRFLASILVTFSKEMFLFLTKFKIMHHENTYNFFFAKIVLKNEK